MQKSIWKAHSGSIAKSPDPPAHHPPRWRQGPNPRAPKWCFWRLQRPWRKLKFCPKWRFWRFPTFPPLSIVTALTIPETLLRAHLAALSLDLYKTTAMVVGAGVTWGSPLGKSDGALTMRHRFQKHRLKSLVNASILECCWRELAPTK